jgi:hypothetical protein
MTFRFYVERLWFSSSCSIASHPVSRGGAYCSGDNNIVTVGYSFFANDNSHDWPTWWAGNYYNFVLNFGSITG